MYIKQNITIVVADDHPIMLNGLCDELVKAGYNVVGKAENGAVALNQIVSLKPQIALLDIDMPLLSGLDVVKRSKEKSPSTKYIMITYHKEKGYVVQAKKCGVNGYLLKEDGIKEIEEAIKTVSEDDFFYSKSFEHNITTIIDEELRKIKLLTPSERTILRLVAKEKSSISIANQLSISIRTVEKHRSNIINKLDLDHKIDALNQWITTNKEVLDFL